MKEYHIGYKCGTSPYWYYVSYYAYNKAEALDMFKKYDSPANVRAIKIVEG